MALLPVSSERHKCRRRSEDHVTGGTLLPSKPEVIKQILHGGCCHIASESLRSRIHQFTGIMNRGQLLTAFRDKEKWVDPDEETIGNMGVGILDRVMKELQNGMFVNRQ